MPHNMLLPDTVAVDDVCKIPSEVATLMDYLKTHKPGPFKPTVMYQDVGRGYLTYYFKDERCYTKRVDDNLDLFIGMETGNVVGFRVYGIKKP